MSHRNLPLVTMPPALGTSRTKGKARESRRSGSRNTTPSSGLSAGTVSSSSVSYLETDVSKLAVQATVQYSDVLEKLNGSGQIPDSKSLESLVENMNSLGEVADSRSDACNAAMKELSQKRKELEPEQDPDREAGEKSKVKVEVEEDEGLRTSKGARQKKRKDKAAPKEERPLAVGSHAVARQDGSDGTLRVSLSLSYP